MTDVGSTQAAVQQNLQFANIAVCSITQACHQAVQISAFKNVDLGFKLLLILARKHWCMDLPAGHEAVAYSTHGTECERSGARAWLKA